MNIFERENFIIRKNHENKIGSGGYADVYKSFNKAN